MADANGLNPGDEGYDPSTESQNPNNAYLNPTVNPTNVNPSPGGGTLQTLGSPFTPIGTPPDQTGITGVNPTAGLGTTPGTDLQLFSYLLSQNPSNPQAAIDQFNKFKPGSSLAPAYYSDRNVIGVQGQSQPYLTAPGTTAGQTAWSFGGSSGGGSGGGSLAIDPSYLTPFTKQFVAPGDPNNPASAAGVLNPKEFTLPTEADLFSSPGYQASQDAVRNAIVDSNASKGLINSGGNIYDLANASAGLEGQQYNDLVNQKASVYGINQGAGQNAFNDAWTKYLNDQSIFYQNQNSPFSKLSTLASLGLSAAGNAG